MSRIPAAEFEAFESDFESTGGTAEIFSRSHRNHVVKMLGSAAVLAITCRLTDIPPVGISWADSRRKRQKEGGLTYSSDQQMVPAVRGIPRPHVPCSQQRHDLSIKYNRRKAVNSNPWKQAGNGTFNTFNPSVGTAVRYRARLLRVAGEALLLLFHAALGWVYGILHRVGPTSARSMRLPRRLPRRVRVAFCLSYVSRSPFQQRASSPPPKWSWAGGGACGRCSVISFSSAPAESPRASGAPPAQSRERGRK